MTYPDPHKPEPTASDPYPPESYAQDPYAQNPYPGAAQPQYGYQTSPQFGSAQSYPQNKQFAPQQPPSANGGWAVASIIFFWPLAFIAVSRAFSVYPLWAQGRYAEADAASASVRKLGIISLAIFAAVIVLYIVVVVVIVAAGVDATSDTTY